MNLHWRAASIADAIVRRLRVTADVVQIAELAVDPNASGQFDDGRLRRDTRRADGVRVHELGWSLDLPADATGERARSARCAIGRLRPGALMGLASMLSARPASSRRDPSSRR